MIQVQSVKDIKPQFEKIERTKAAAPSGGVLYNDASIVYNSGTVLYGGVDKTVDLGPKLEPIANIIPKENKVINL